MWREQTNFLRRASPSRELAGVAQLRVILVRHAHTLPKSTPPAPRPISTPPPCPVPTLVLASPLVCQRAIHMLKEPVCLLEPVLLPIRQLVEGGLVHAEDPLEVLVGQALLLALGIHAGRASGGLESSERVEGALRTADSTPQSARSRTASERGGGWQGGKAEGDSRCTTTHRRRRGEARGGVLGRSSGEDLGRQALGDRRRRGGGGDGRGTGRQPPRHGRRWSRARCLRPTKA